MTQGLVSVNGGTLSYILAPTTGSYSFTLNNPSGSYDYTTVNVLPSTQNSTGASLALTYLS